MVDNFTELLETISYIRKGNPTTDEMGNPVYPITIKNFRAIVEDDVSVLKELALGYTVDKYIYTNTKLIETDIIKIRGEEYIIKKISNCIDHYELTLVKKNV